MQKNVASQKLIVYAYDATLNTPKTGDAANITAYVSKDYGTVTVLADTSATEMDSTNAKGYYLFDLAQAETNADTLLFSAKSATANIYVVGSPPTVFTTPASFSSFVTPTNLTAAQIATGVWQDATAGDFTTASSIGKSLYTSNVAPGGANGHTICGSNAATTFATLTSTGAFTVNGVSTVSQTGDSFARIGATGSGLSTLATAANLATTNTTVNTINTNTTGLSGVTFPATVASPTNITAGTITTVTNLTNAPGAGDFTTVMKTSIGTAVAASAVASVTGNVGGNVTGTVAGVTPATAAGILSAALTESYATDGSAATLTQLLYMVWSLLAERNVSGTTLTAKKLDGSTTSMTFTLNSATQPTGQTRAT